MREADIEMQRVICARYGTVFSESPKYFKVGIAQNVRDKVYPLNGLRHPPEGTTTGWYIWAGEELSEAPEFFLPLHVAHLADWCPVILPYLGLPAGWRFLIAPGYEDVWYDDSLLNIDR
ncbi:MAG TPA: hypothetical protein VIL85_03035 [Thermomicrobiales bacterium]|jgi:hypothetical protein